MLKETFLYVSICVGGMRALLFAWVERCGCCTGVSMLVCMCVYGMGVGIVWI